MPLILLIDDNAMQLCIRATVLRDAGFAVLPASTAEQALAALRTQDCVRVDAIVTDHLLPGIQGPEIVQALRTLDPHVPVIAISGLPGAESEYAGLNVVFLRKPCRPEELIRHLKASLGIRTSAPVPN